MMVVFTYYHGFILCKEIPMNNVLTKSVSGYGTQAIHFSRPTKEGVKNPVCLKKFNTLFEITLSRSFPYKK